MSVTINEGTQTNVLTDLVVGTETQVVRLDMGDGTAASRFGGTIAEITNIAGGTVVTTAADIPGGTIDTLGTVGMLNDGSVAVTALSDLPGGTVDILTNGTIAVSAIEGDIAGGTVDLITSVADVAGVSEGTLSDVAVTALPDLPGGTIDSITNVAGGTVISDNYTFRHADAFGSVGTVAGTATTTVVGSVAGSAIYVTDIVISTNDASEVTVGDGVETVPLLGPLHLAANGGMVGNFVTPLNTSAGSNLIVKQTGSGTISVTAEGYID